jgi:N-acetyl-gamma-glutamyl-phosphate reductase
MAGIKKIFIDGQEGTTGLKIIERFQNRDDIVLLRIDESKRKDIKERKKLINQSDITFLCLPDSAAKEAVNLVENPAVKIIDASTAHRINPGWAYGFPELSPKHFSKIQNSNRVAVPGCYASGFTALVYPLVLSGLMQPHYPVVTYGISGYSGGGKARIAQYQDPNRPVDFESPMLYALGLTHKHLPEMQVMSGISYKPMFTPIIADYFNGMVVVVPIQSRLLHRRLTADDVRDTYARHYKGKHFVTVIPKATEEDLNSCFLAASALKDTNNMEIMVLGNDEQILLVSRFDNLAKGASGAAVQCMNIMLGLEESIGL